MLEVVEPLQDVKLSEQDICNTSATVIDGGLLIHAKFAAVKKIGTYGNFAWSVLKTACREVGKEVHILFDTYGTESLKNKEAKVLKSLIPQSQL